MTKSLGTGRGRPRKSPAELALAGGRRPPPLETPRFVMVDPPPGLSPGARVFWSEHAPGRCELGVLTMGTRPVFGQLCEHAAMIDRCRRLIADQGDVIVGERGVQRHPCLITLSSALPQFTALAGLFGMTPPAAARLVQPREVEDSSDLLSGPWPVGGQA